jgi:1-phosphatidylinositol phosphodiesterase
MALWGVVRGTFDTTGRGLVAGAYLGLNSDANNACLRSVDRFGKDVSTVGSDTAGLLANAVAPVIQCCGHGLASGSLTVADLVTFKQVTTFSEIAENQAILSQTKLEQASEGMAHVLNVRDISFNDAPQDVGPWMSRLPGSTKVCDMFLPGTHNSGAFFGGDLAQCQGWSMGKQLSSGIRCFDVSLRKSGTDLYVQRGLFHQRQNFDCVADTFECFLQQNPSEVIFVRIDDSDNKQCSEEFVNFVRSQIEARPVFSKFETDFSGLSLEEMRGHIFAIQGGFGKVPTDIQEEMLGDARAKFEEVRRHGVKERKDGTLYINYFSSCGADGMTWATPSGIARHVNAEAVRAMADFKPSVFMLDYPGTGLVEKIITRNGISLS